MTAATFYMPSPPNEIDDILGEIWKEGNARHLICVERIMSSRGNPCVRGLSISATESIPHPSEFEVHHLPEDHIDVTCQNFKDKMNAQDNGFECF